MFLPIALNAQTLLGQDNALRAANAREALRSQLERSTFFPLGALGNMPSVWFEGTIAPPFVLFERPRVAVIGTPKVVVRMARDGSSTIRAPSYMPRAVLYFSTTQNPLPILSRYVTLTISHHSNGQEGPFRRPDGEINDSTGNFSTNYLELGYYSLNADADGFGGGWLSLQVHPKWFFPDDSVTLHYSHWRARFGGSYSFNNGWHSAIEAGLLLDRKGGHMDQWHKRVNGSLTVAAPLPWSDELSIIANAYAGEDYYNMSFIRYRTILRVGLSTHPPRQALGAVLAR